MIFHSFGAFLLLAGAVFQAFASTIISIVGALPCVYFFNRFNFLGKRLMLALIPLLCIMPSKLTALGVSLFSCDGFLGIVWGHCALNMPLAFFVIYSATQTMNPQWQLIAQECGARPWQAYRDIDFPFLRPTIFSTGVIIFLLCFTSYSIPQILGTADHHLTLDIMMQQSYAAHDSYGTLIYFILRLLILVPLCFIKFKHHGNGWLEQGLIEKRFERYTIQKHGAWWAFILCGVSALILAPLLIVLWNSLNGEVVNFWRTVAAGMPDAIVRVPIYQVIGNSVMLALSSGILAVLLGFLLCKIMARARSGLIKRTIALLSVIVFLFGSVGCGIFFSWMAQTTFYTKFVIATLCHTILNYPFAYRIINAQLGAWQPEWDLSAQSFGATAADRLFTLEWPFLRRAFMQAFCISFGLSLTEVGAGSVMNSELGITIPMAIRMYREQGMQHAVIGLSVILLMIVFLLTFFLGFKKEKLKNS